METANLDLSNLKENSLPLFSDFFVVTFILTENYYNYFSNLSECTMLLTIFSILIELV